MEKISVRITSDLNFYESNNQTKTVSLAKLKPKFYFLVQKMDDTNQQDKGKTAMFKISWHYNIEATPQKIQLSSYQKQFVR